MLILRGTGRRYHAGRLRDRDRDYLRLIFLAFSAFCARFAGFWRWLAKPFADCPLVFVPVVGEQSLAGAERGSVSGSFLNVAAEAF